MAVFSNINASATLTALQSAGNANANGAHIDLQPYKGAVTFLLAVGQITSGLGAANLAVANVETSTDNTTFTVPTGGAFTPVINAANASNVGVQTRTYDVRDIGRYARVRIAVEGTNTNIPVSAVAIGMKERV